jgi:hypothetical protein
MKFYPAELHTHTCHSDGAQSVAELTLDAEKLGLKVLALTDHNTMSGCWEIESDKLTVITGIEWTTFFGHILVLEPDFFVDYRGVDKNDFDKSLKKLREADATVGIAHPFRLGNPFCTGCFFEYGVRDYGLFDYVEVWSMARPAETYENIRAVKFYKSLLDKGYRLAATSGLDWHGAWQTRNVFARTYIGIADGEKKSGKTFAAAIKKGRTYMTYGHTIDVTLGEKRIGGEVKSGRAVLSYKVCGKENAEYIEQFRINVQSVNVYNNGKLIHTSQDMKEEVELQVEQGWLLIEAEGSAGMTESTVLMTSPFYVTGNP